MGFQKFVLFGLIVPLLLVSNNLPNPNKKPESNASVICNCELSASICVLNGCGEPVNQKDLVVGCEDEIQSFNQKPWIVFTNVNPSVVLPSLFVASFSPEVVG
jgi:hypothetical protein